MFESAENHSVPPIGIMQGRLAPPEDGRFQSFPRQSWREEFSRAAAARLNCIEWIHDHFGHDVNPITTDNGIAEMKRLMDTTGVGVVSLCADWFMESPLVRATSVELSERLNHLGWLIEQCQKAGIKRLTLPFVDASGIDGPDDVATVVASLRQVLPRAEAAQVEIHLETALPPAPFAKLLAELDPPCIGVNYDSGNSASLGFSVRDEFAAYGHRIGSVHVKDRRKGGGTVPLGTGDADLPAFFDCLGKFGYHKELILQVARGTPGDEVAWAAQNRQYVLNLWKPANTVEGGGR